jgi:hypothetical protein
VVEDEGARVKPDYLQAALLAASLGALVWWAWQPGMRGNNVLLLALLPIVPP